MNMKNLVIANAAMTMTLKEITDLLDVRHNNAMRTVAEMAKDQDFGTITQIEYTLQMPNNATRQMETYQLNKRQSIAVASRLNTALLMRIIDRWQELENQSKPSLPTTYIAATHTGLRRGCQQSIWTTGFVVPKLLNMLLL